MPLQNAYPVFFALAGVIASSILSGRALALMNADAKAALIDSLSSTRLLNGVALVAFFGLIMWRPLIGWAFLGCAYLGLGARSVVRLRRMNLPPHAARLILIGNICAVAGIALCAFTFVARGLE